MNIRHRRTAAVLAALAVTGVTTAGIVAGTASAAGTGTCTENVNVRSQPSKSAPIVGTCEKGQSTRVGEKRAGFVKLDEFGGWASEEYVRTGSAGTAAPNQADEAPSGTSEGGSLVGGNSRDRGSSADESGTDSAGSDSAGSDSAGSDSAGSDSAGTGSGGSSTGGSPSDSSRSDD